MSRRASTLRAQAPSNPDALAGRSGVGRETRSGSSSRAVPAALALRDSATLAPPVLTDPAPLGKARTRAAVPDDLAEQSKARCKAVRWYRAVKCGDQEAPLGVHNREELADFIGAQQQPPVSGRMIREYERRFAEALKAGENAEAAVCDRLRKDRGESRFFAAHPDAAAFVQQKYLVERIGNVSLVHEALEREFDRFRCKGHRLSDGNLAPCQVPDNDTVRRYLRELPHPLKTLALVGPRTWRNGCAPHIQRQRPRPGECIVYDDRRLDSACRNTLFRELAPGVMYRLSLSAAIDWGTGAWLGYCFAPESNARTAMSASRMALAEIGFPRSFYWDNGENYKKMERLLQGRDLGDAFGETLANFLRDNGIEFAITRALPYRPASKPIESAFSVMSRRNDLIWGDAYQGNSTAHRTEYNELAQKRHKKWLLGKAPETPLPTDVEVIAGTIQWMLRENNRPRRALGWRTPLQALEEFHPAENRRMVGRDLLNVLFSERDKRIVQRGGCLKLDARSYEPDDSSLGALSMLQGREVLVLRDSYALENAVALDPETLAFVGELRLQEFVAQCPNGHITRDQIKANERRVGHLRKMFTAHLAWLAGIAERQGWQSERQVLLAEAGFAATGTDGRELPAGAAPGAQPQRALPPARAAVPALASAFISDDVKRDADVWAQEDDDAAAR